ncbi:heme-binding domain-containing protein [Sulfurimonas sp. SAG-AH-194-I05]|nr:heme-binding domain-containing protein [Sulfurimonas sp. SAG-AH-194-I05]MDF1875475.1 heme-binding domain-containing protein [Sulfurimonas sp. SAG-AH-194-I05]
MLKKIAIIVLVIFFSIQFIPVDTTNPVVDETLTLQAPQEVMTLLKKSCYDCHSNETVWPFYSQIAPVSFFVAVHVEEARSAVNFSEWKFIDKETKTKRLQRAIITVKNGMMALPSYLVGHEEAKLTKEEKKVLVTWFEDTLKEINEDSNAHIFQVR